jgi:Tol biopolymer transport system component
LPAVRGGLKALVILVAAALLAPAVSAAAVPLGGTIVYPVTTLDGEEYVGGLKIDRGAAPTGPSTWLTRDVAQEEPSISPDGRKIAFVYDDPNLASTGPSGIAVMDSSGGAATSLTDGRYDRGPTFSPDGGLLAFSREGSIYLIGSDGSGLRQLTDDPKRADKAPAFVADGTEVVFTRVYLEGGHQTKGLYSVPVGGGPIRKFLDGSAPEAEATFSANGRRMAYVAGGALMLARANGTHPRRLNGTFRSFSESHAAQAPVFSPDSRYLAFLAYSVDPGSFEQRLAVLQISGKPRLLGTIARGAGGVESGTGLGVPAWGPEP